MTPRAAEMAKIMMEQLGEDEDCERLALKLFANDKLSDLEKAVEIFAELEDADAMADDFFAFRKGKG